MDIDKSISYVDDDIDQLIQEARFEEAETKAKNLLANSPKDVSAVRSYIGVLLRRDIAEKTVLASAVLLDNSELIDDLQMFSATSFKLWQDKNYERAIDVAKKALSIAENKNNTQETMDTIKANLAYYFTETEKKEYQELARQYATKAHNSNPADSNRLDTLGSPTIASPAASSGGSSPRLPAAAAHTARESVQ